MVQKYWIYLLWLLRYDCFYILRFDFRFGQEVKVKLGSPFCKYFLTINDRYNGTKILNLPVVVVEIWFCKISKFDFRFGQEVKVKLGSPSKYFLTINDLYNSSKNLNLHLAVVEIWFCLIVNFNFRFGQEVSIIVQKIVNLHMIFCNSKLAVVEIWFCLIVNFNFRFGQEVKVKLGSPFCKYYFEN